MLVVNRFHEPDEGFRDELETARGVLAAQTGYVDGSLGRNVDDPELWVLVTHWRDVGSYRRALSTYDVKVGVVPLLSRSIDEPSAYESLEGDQTGELNVNHPRSNG